MELVVVEGDDMKERELSDILSFQDIGQVADDK
jgi:hypothetical protein